MDFVQGLKLALQKRATGTNFELVRSSWEFGEHVVLDVPQQEGLMLFVGEGELRMLEQEDVLADDWVIRQRGSILGKPFEWALTQLKAGQRVCRKGWTGQGMALRVVGADDWTSAIGFDNAHRLPWIAMKTADGGLVPWVASQTDLLSNDWELAG